ncbi:MAG: CDP-glucose 4,6-dehydratase [Pseudomonadota bacterium]
MKAFGGVYAGKRVLVTGHTGFKGSWLTFWLKEMGAEVTGLALPPNTAPNHWDLLKLDINDRRGDIRDAAFVAEVVKQANPEVVFHLAAQPLVRESYRDPVGTWGTNLMGTVHLLEACRLTKGVRAIVVVTTDKVYENREWPWGYRETDRLGGHDPYSASKAAAEIAIGSYRKAFFADGGPLLASARGGNVIGGGDWSQDRLIPDLIRATQAKGRLEIRSPGATRPWQHVLECLTGYLLLCQHLLGGGARYAEAWNFGPGVEDNRTVAEILTQLRSYWPGLEWFTTSQSQPHEANLLYVDNAKSHAALGWKPVWNLQHCLEATAGWYRAWYENSRVESGVQLDTYVQDARAAGVWWAGS